MSFAIVDVEETKLKGIVYTEKPIAEFMCRMALYAYLVSSFSVLSDISIKTERGLLSDLVFAGRVRGLSPEILSRIGALMLDVKVIDPAVGTGVFLTTMMDEILRIVHLVDADRDLDKVAQHLVKYALYGVDIHEEAVLLCRKALHSKMAYYGLDVSSIEELSEERIIVGDSLFDLGVEYQEEFDVIICNPPYVRQEILPRKYKTRLQEYYPQLPVSSDLFTYFFLFASILLKPSGVAVMITPISWLDVQYGASLQEFLMKHMPCHAVFYSDIEKWFPSASISTCISLHTDSKGFLDSTVFVNLKKSIDVYLKQPMNGSVSLFSDILSREHVPGIFDGEEYRLYCIRQKCLYNRGVSGSKYIGSKWTSYLRAPESFYRLQEICSDRLIPLENITKITRGYTTGCNRFFYVKTSQTDHQPDVVPIETVDSEGNVVTFQVEARYLKQLIKSPREVKGYKIREDELSYSVLLVEEADKEHLQGRRVLDYINWGEDQGYHLRSSLRRRPVWWCLPELLPSQVLFRQFYDIRFNLPLNEAGFATDHTFYYSVGFPDEKLLGALMNSTIVYFFLELNGRINQSDGVLTCYGPELRRLRVPLPDCFTGEIQEELLNAYDVMCQRDALSIFDEVECEDRRRLDHVILRGLGVVECATRQALLEEIYCNLAELVENRIGRAKK
jgi:hypothetical protein